MLNDVKSQTVPVLQEWGLCPVCVQLGQWEAVLGKRFPPAAQNLLKHKITI